MIIVFKEWPNSSFHPAARSPQGMRIHDPGGSMSTGRFDLISLVKYPGELSLRLTNPALCITVSPRFKKHDSSGAYP
jgi:hypothetical protein